MREGRAWRQAKSAASQGKVHESDVTDKPSLKTAMNVEQISANKRNPLVLCTEIKESCLECKIMFTNDSILWNEIYLKEDILPCSKETAYKTVSPGLVHKDQCNCGSRRTSSFHSCQQILSLLAVWCWFLSACKMEICMGSCGLRGLQKSNNMRQGWNPINMSRDATEWGCKNETQIAVETPWCCRCQEHVVPTEEICRLKNGVGPKDRLFMLQGAKDEEMGVPNPFEALPILPWAPCCVVVNLMQARVVWKEELSNENMSP